MTISFGIIGAGWRSEFFARISHYLPEKFQLRGTVIRDKQKKKVWEKKWRTTGFTTIESMTNTTDLDFVITAVPWAVNPNLIKELIDLGIPVLSETPPAPDIEALIDLYEYVRDHNGKVQVAEQYPLRPQHQAQLQFIKTGLLGEITFADVSIAHGYHGISLLRRLLGIESELGSIRSFQFNSPILQGADRTGFPSQRRMSNSRHNHFIFKFENDKYGIVDFTEDQYFGFIRNNRITIRGTTGEIHNNSIYWMKDHQNPRRSTFQRLTLGTEGDINGNYLYEIQANGETYYSNPYHHPMMDEEIAVAEVLKRMGDFVTSDTPFYSLAEGCQDHYLYLLGQESIKKNQTVIIDQMPWEDNFGAISS